MLLDADTCPDHDRLRFCIWRDDVVLALARLLGDLRLLLVVILALQREHLNLVLPRRLVGDTTDGVEAEWKVGRPALLAPLGAGTARPGGTAFVCTFLENVGVQWTNRGDAGERDGRAELGNGPDDNVDDAPYSIRQE